MIVRLEITCITRAPAQSPEIIKYIGGLYPDGSRFKFTQQEAIGFIEKDEYSFFITLKDKTFGVIVGYDENGNKYLRSIKDFGRIGDLLKLPGCP